MKSTNAKYLNLPEFADSRGNLNIIEGKRHIPFEIQEISLINDLAEKNPIDLCNFAQSDGVVIALNGKFDVVIDDDNDGKFSLDRKDIGLFITASTQATIENFSSDALCLILSSSKSVPNILPLTMIPEKQEE